MAVGSFRNFRVPRNYRGPGGPTWPSQRPMTVVRSNLGSAHHLRRTPRDWVRAPDRASSPHYEIGNCAVWVRSDASRLLRGITICSTRSVSDLDYLGAAHCSSLWGAPSIFRTLYGHHEYHSGKSRSFPSFTDCTISSSSFVSMKRAQLVGPSR